MKAVWLTAGLLTPILMMVEAPQPRMVRPSMGAGIVIVSPAGKKAVEGGITRAAPLLEPKFAIAASAARKAGASLLIPSPKYPNSRMSI